MLLLIHWFFKSIICQEKIFDKMINPKISIIMPVYGVEQYIHKSVESVLAQTYKNYELILVDDESPDACPQICDDYAKKYFHVQVIHQKNKGLPGARNAGMSLVSGEYVYFLDSDDVMQPNALEYFVKAINAYPHAEMIFSRFQSVSLGDEFKEVETDEGIEVFKQAEIQEHFLFRTHVILAPGTLYKVSWYVENNLSFQRIPYSEDQSFVWYALLRVSEVVYIKSELYNYLTRPGSIMTSSKYLTILKAYPYYKKLSECYNACNSASSIVNKYLLSRWVCGICHSAAHLCSYKEYKTILNGFEVKLHCQNLRSYPSVKVKVLASLFFVSKKLFYMVNRWI